MAFSRISFQLHRGSSVIVQVQRMRSSLWVAMRVGKSPRCDNRGGVSRLKVRNTNPAQVSSRTGTMPFSIRSNPSASFMSGQP